MRPISRSRVNDLVNRGKSAFSRELDAWEADGCVAEFWLRDDDAVADTPALRRYLGLMAEHAVSPLIAAIPARAEPSLVELCAERQVPLAVHGIRHENQAPPSGKKCELGGGRPIALIARDLEHAFADLASMAGDTLLRVLVPPWNRIDPELIPELPGLGFAGLSGFDPHWERPQRPGLRTVNTHLDIIDWRGGRVSRPADRLFQTLGECLATARGRGIADPVGILTHHLDHDAGAGVFLAELAETVARHPAARWIEPGGLWPKWTNWLHDS